ncbi:hypothetical protein BB558_000587 [Smittium angustum]|uniref:2-dehydropantoate 2-reductase n=1 Tax=Smittium angustum TaxID=133377 RepID=A0A2U1JDS3_SMIAN|nr:hypothetical protein BB558_000587 [Smittium angustum]
MMQPTLKRIHVLGIGSIGSLFAFHLVRNANPVSLIFKTREKADLFIKSGSKIGILEQYKIENDKNSKETAISPYHSTLNNIGICYQSGFIAETSKGEYSTEPQEKTRESNKLNSEQIYKQTYSVKKASSINTLLVTTKTYQTLTAIKNISHRLSNDPVIIILQNGMGVIEELLEYFLSAKNGPSPKFIIGTTSHGCMPQKKNFCFDHTGFGSLYFAEYEGNNYNKDNLNPNVKHVLEILSKLPLEPKIIEYPELYQQLLLKLAVNAIINPITALNRCRNGLVFETQHEIHKNLIPLLCKEIETIYRAVFKPTMPNFALESNIYTNTFNVSKNTSNNHSSMLRDVENGNKTEIDYINGYLVRLATSFGIDAKYNKMLCEYIKKLS